MRLHLLWRFIGLSMTGIICLSDIMRRDWEEAKPLIYYFFFVVLLFFSLLLIPNTFNFVLASTNNTLCSLIYFSILKRYCFLVIMSFIVGLSSVCCDVNSWKSMCMISQWFQSLFCLPSEHFCDWVLIAIHVFNSFHPLTGFVCNHRWMIHLELAALFNQNQSNLADHQYFSGELFFFFMVFVMKRQWSIQTEIQFASNSMTSTKTELFKPEPLCFNFIPDSRL